MTPTSTPTPTRRPGSAHLAGRPVLAWFSVGMLIAALGIGFVLGRATTTDPTPPPPDLADTEVTRMLTDFVVATNRGDEPTLEALFASDATLAYITKDGSDVVQGDTAIAAAMASWCDLGIRITDAGTAVHAGEYVAQSQRWHAAQTMTVYRLQDGKIQDMWVIQP